MPTLICPECEHSFDISRQEAKRGRRFCSRTCANRFNQPKDPTKRSMFTCDWCNKIFEEWTYRQPRFCSNQCRSEFAARQPRPRTRRPANFLSLTCEWCGHTYTIHKNIIENPIRETRFCSAECKYAAMSVAYRGKGNPNWTENKTESHYYGPDWPQQCQKARARDNHKCRICTITTQEVGHALPVHQIVPFREFGSEQYKDANCLSNLITLCPVCHPKVERHIIPCPKPIIG